MGDLIVVGALGLFLGVKHATDPDHVIAISTIVARYRTIAGAAAIGAVWGIGHTATVLIIGTGIVLFGWVIPERVGLSMELGVGLMLIVLGVITLRRWWQRAEYGAALQSDEQVHAHSHAHAHGDYVHTHPHGHHPEHHPHRDDQTPLGWLDRHFGEKALYHLARPLLIGVVHGLAGSAAVALLVVPAIGDPRWAVVYLMVFGIGTIAGMLAITAIMATPMAYSGRHAVRVQGGLSLASGVFSLCFGIILAYHVGSLLIA
jgi:high-affinity nickel-transport protein